jgi:hypothetical protein
MRLPDETELYGHDVGDIGGMQTVPSGFNPDFYQETVGPIIGRAMKKTADRFGLGQLGKYADPVIGKNAYNGFGKTRGERFLEKVARPLGYRVEYVPGTRVDRDGNLGATYFDDEVIYIPRDTSRARRSYVALHESHEAMEKAKNPAYTARGREHSLMELKVLNYMKDHNWEEELDDALGLHMERYGGSNREVFADIQQQVYNMYIERNAEKKGMKGIYSTGPLDEILAVPKNYATDMFQRILNTRGSN